MFILSQKQLDKVEEWKKTLSKEPDTAIGGAFTYEFTPTSIGTIIKVKYHNGTSIDLTEYEDF